MKLPSLCKQKRSSGDLAYVRINGAKIYCGPWGSVETAEKYERIIAEWLTTVNSGEKTEEIPVEKRKVGVERNDYCITSVSL